MKKTLVLICLCLMTTSVFAVDFDVNQYDESELVQIRDMIDLKLVDSKKGDLLYEDENISINYLGWKREYSETTLWVSIVNKSNKNLTVSTRDTSVNECSIDCSFPVSVLAGKWKNGYIISIYDSTLKEQWIDDIEYVEFKINYYDSDDWFGLDVDIHDKYIIKHIE